MSTIATLCESRDLPFDPFMEAVEEFVDSMVEEPSLELYEATAKRLLGEALTHEEIMMDVPKCGPNDVIVLDERADKYKVNISLDTQMHVWLNKYKLGRKGLESLVKSYRELTGNKDGVYDPFFMGKAARMHGVSPRVGQVILTKVLRKKGMLEHYYQLAESLLNEEVPTNTADSGMPDHKPTDGGKNRLGKKKMHHRKDDEEE